MNHALKAKLLKRLKNAFATQRAFSATTLRDVLIDIRSLLELLEETERYKILKFHCDWILHPKLTGPRAQRIIKAVDNECTKSVAKAGQQDWPESVGSDFFGPVSQEFVTELLGRFTFHHFEAEVQRFLHEHKIASLPDPSTSTYRAFDVLYCQLIEDRTWDYTNKKDLTSFVNRVCVRMQERCEDDSIPHDHYAFPLVLTWTFSGNDEQRLRFNVEFLGKRP